MRNALYIQYQVDMRQSNDGPNVVFNVTLVHVYPEYQMPNPIPMQVQSISDCMCESASH